jgi:hypothetical protein
MDIKKKGDTSLFVRTSPGRYTLRALATGSHPVQHVQSSSQSSQSNGVAAQPMSALATRKPAAPAPASSTATVRRADTAEGGGFAS